MFIRETHHQANTSSTTTMPQGSNASKSTRKGRAPAHANKFAFHHNPKSKKTAQILASPNEHVCRRCHDKIEWRKQYRQYKPRTQLGKCNFCEMKRIQAAYHTICGPCSLGGHPKGKELLDEYQQENPDCKRVCCMCTKEPALPDDDEGPEEVAALEAKLQGKLSLRQRKTIERQLERSTKRKSNEDGEEEEDDEEKPASEDELPELEEDDEAEDPFLQAIGGADQLVTGEAYQQRLLEKLQSAEKTEAEN